MFQPMTALKQILTATIILLLPFQLAACGQVTPVPTSTAGLTPSLSATTSPSPINTTTHSVTVAVLPTCTSIPNNYIYIVDRATYIDSGAGLELGLGPSGAIAVLQQALDEHHPAWGQEEDLATDVWSYSGAQNIGVNPRVLLVTTGVALDWQIPKNHDL